MAKAKAKPKQEDPTRPFPAPGEKGKVVGAKKPTKPMMENGEIPEKRMMAMEEKKEHGKGKGGGKGKGKPMSKGMGGVGKGCY